MLIIILMEFISKINLFYGNLYNSKAVLFALDGHLVSRTDELNKIHTGDVFSEKYRVVTAGGRVVGGVVNGQGRLSRRLGTHGKKGLIALPDVTMFKIDSTKVTSVVSCTNRLSQILIDLAPV